MARRVLVTGATGFLGGYVVRDLQRRDVEVFGHGRDERALLARVDATHAVVGDLEQLRNRALSVDAVIHCAALSTPWGAAAAFDASNIQGTQAVIDFMSRNDVRRLVHVSSPSVYAQPTDRLGIREEEVPHTRPLNGYIRSKLAAEGVVRGAYLSGQIPEAVMVRPRGLIGVGDPSLVPRLLRVHDRLGLPLFDGGENVIDITAVENVALALRLALDHGDPAAPVYNITNAQPRSFRSLADALLRGTGRTPHYRRLPRSMLYRVAGALEGVCRVVPGHPEPPLTRYTLTTIGFSQTLDISRARVELGYRPEVDLEDSLRRVARHVREEQEGS